jgi:phosphoinositide-3-kinase, regulatory subunit 4
LYFGHLDNNIRCYTAPERWTSQKSTVKGAKLEPSMDIFSAGCVIAEIMMDDPLFDLARL